MNPQKKYIIFKKLPQLGLNKEDWKLVQQIKAQGYEWSSWVRQAIRDKATGLYCTHCGDLLSEHLITDRGGACVPIREKAERDGQPKTK